MSRSLWAIAELAWRQINPKGKDEAKNTLEEFVESAKDQYADLTFNMWVEFRNESDLSIIEQLLTRKKYDVSTDRDGQLFTELEFSIMDLPRDLGVFQVVPPKQNALIKSTIGTYDLFHDDPGEFPYYRIGKKLYYPEGFAVPGTKEVMITFVSIDFIDEELEVPDLFADKIRSGLLQKYGSTAQIPQDTTNNKNANN